MKIDSCRAYDFENEFLNVRFVSDFRIENHGQLIVKRLFGKIFEFLIEPNPNQSYDFGLEGPKGFD